MFRRVLSYKLWTLFFYSSCIRWKANCRTVQLRNSGTRCKSHYSSLQVQSYPSLLKREFVTWRPHRRSLANFVAGGRRFCQTFNEARKVAQTHGHHSTEWYMALSWDEIKSIIVLIKIPPHPFGCGTLSVYANFVDKWPDPIHDEVRPVISILSTSSALGRTFKRYSIAKLSSNPYLDGWLHLCCEIADKQVQCV